MFSRLRKLLERFKTLFGEGPKAEAPMPPAVEPPEPPPPEPVLPVEVKSTAAMLLAKLQEISQRLTAGLDNIPEISAEISQLERVLQEREGWLDEQYAARLTGLALRALTAEHVPGRGPRLEQALRLFREFRRHSSAAVPEAHRLTEQLAASGANQPDALRAYVEYLAPGSAAGQTLLEDSGEPSQFRIAAADGIASVLTVYSTSDSAQPIGAASSVPECGADHCTVLRVLREACRPGRPDSQSWNRLVEDVCHFPWACLNLVQIALENGDYEMARRKFESIYGEGAKPAEAGLATLAAPPFCLWPTAQIEFLGGLVYRGVQRWKSAVWHFDNSLRLAPADPVWAGSAAARVLLIEARIYELEEQLRDGSATVASPLEVGRRWEAWQTELVELGTELPPDGLVRRSGTMAPGELDVPALITALLIRLDRRLLMPPQVVRRVEELVGDWVSHAAADAGLDELLFEVGGPDATKRYHAAGSFADPIPVGQWLLRQGQLTKLRGLLATWGNPETAPAVENSPAALLWAAYQLGIGQRERAQDVLSGRNWAKTSHFDTFQRLQVEFAMAGCDNRGVAARLQDPAAMVLPAALRKLYENELAHASELQEGEINWQSDIARFHELAEAAPDWAPALVALGFCLLELGQDEEAAKSFARAAELEELNLRAKLGLALADPDAAAAEGVIGNLLSEEPFLQPHLDSLAVRLAAAGRYDLVQRLPPGRPGPGKKRPGKE